MKLSFVLAYDFEACRKVWDAFYANLSGGILGLDSDKEGNFIVAGYDESGFEYVFRHTSTGQLPTIWKFDVSASGGPIVPGGIHFAFNDEYICLFSPLLYKQYRYDQPSDFDFQIPVYNYAALGGALFRAASGDNIMVLGYRLSNQIFV